VLAIQLALLALLIGLWQVLAQTKVVDVSTFGEPSGVWEQLKTWVVSGTDEGSLWVQIWVTLQETLFGFGIGVGCGVTCGILLGRVPILADILGVYIGTMNSIPRIVLGSVFIIWFGLGISSKVALAALLVFFSVFFNAFQGAREVDEGLISNAHVLGASRLAVVFQVVMPSAFSWIIASLRVAFGFAITGAIVGELLGATQGLGILIAQAQGVFNPDGVYAGLVITSVVAMAAEGLITIAERYLLRWRPPRRVAGLDS
jgi:NitT/TauT family transport system permease protein